MAFMNAAVTSTPVQPGIACVDLSVGSIASAR